MSILVCGALVVPSPVMRFRGAAVGPRVHGSAGPSHGDCECSIPVIGSIIAPCAGRGAGLIRATAAPTDRASHGHSRRWTT